MVRFASLWAALLSAAVLLTSAPSWACDQRGPMEPKVVSSRRQARTPNVLDRVDRILDGACACAASTSASCSCRPGRRMFEKLSGTRSSPQLPRDARYDASAGVFL